jgi:hypothetical protein
LFGAFVLDDVATYPNVIYSYPYIGRRCQNMGDHPKKISGGSLIGNLLEQRFCSILSKKAVSYSLTQI